MNYIYVDRPSDRDRLLKLGFEPLGFLIEEAKIWAFKVGDATEDEVESALATLEGMAVLTNRLTFA